MKPRMLHIAFVLLLMMAGCGDVETIRREDGKTVGREDGKTVGQEDGKTLRGEETANGERRTANGERRTANGERQTANGERQTANGERQTNGEEAPYFIPDYSIDHMDGISRVWIDEKSGRGPRVGMLFGMAPEELAFFKRGRTAPAVVLGLHFDNDMWDYTDYYYTSGLALEVFHPAIGGSPFVSVLPGLRSSLNYCSIALRQNLYTPQKIDRDTVQTGDRPFAAYLTLEHRKISLSPEKRRRLESELTLGIIGPAAMGRASQDLIHDDEPVGWANQIANDVVINYTLRYEQEVYAHGRFELGAYGGGQAGTLYDNLRAGIVLQAGKSNDRYSDIFLANNTSGSFKKRIRYYFTLDLENKLVFYDATLQGGMFNHSSVYTLSGDQLNRYVFTGKAGLGIGLGRYSLELEQVFLTPEFEGGKHHFWLRISNRVYLN